MNKTAFIKTLLINVRFYDHKGIYSRRILEVLIEFHLMLIVKIGAYKIRLCMLF